ncbi:MAG: HD-GYP domain-containing protein [Actinomycetota bacterium]
MTTGAHEPDRAQGPARGRHHLDRQGVLLLVLLLGAPAVLLAIARALPALDPVFESPLFHVYVVSGIAACALLVAIATAVFAHRDGRPAPVLLAIGCVAVGFMMLAHGATTPGIFGRPMNLWVGRLPVLALATFAACLAAAADRDGLVCRLVAKAPRTALGVPTGAIALACAAIAFDPTALSGSAPVAFESQIRTVLLAGSAFSLLVVGSLHWKRWRLSRSRIEVTLVLASWLAMSALLSLTYGQFWRMSWWDYHLYLLAGFAAAAWAVVVGYRRSRSLAGAVGGLSVRDPVEQVAQEQPDALHALIGAVEAKDPYTHGHSERVAEISTRIGLRLDLAPEVVRGLHQGAFLHDVGKIGVPDQVLNKQGELYAEEWREIQRHPEVGWELVSRAHSLRGALSAVRNHHERWDGSGYPDQLAGTDIPLAGRIVAVSDVWDALTSDRAYRPAWEPDRAVSHIAAASGTLFDPECVEAFLDIVAELGLVPDRTRADLAGLVGASGDCHPRERRPSRLAAPGPAIARSTSDEHRSAEILDQPR